MIAEMKNIVEECLKNPTRPSIWSVETGKYVCPEGIVQLAGVSGASLQQMPLPAQAHAQINPAFKLIFLTAAGGTVLFTVICVVLHLASGGAPPPATEKFIQGMFDLVKIGFGAIVGLLGGKALDHPASRP